MRSKRIYKDPEGLKRPFSPEANSELRDFDPTAVPRVQEDGGNISHLREVFRMKAAGEAQQDGFSSGEFSFSRGQLKPSLSQRTEYFTTPRPRAGVRQISVQLSRLNSQNSGEPFEREADEISQQIVTGNLSGKSRSHLSQANMSVQCSSESAETSVPATAPQNSLVSDAKKPIHGLIVEDSSTELLPGQMKKGAFLALLRTEVFSTAEAALSGTIWSAAGCPWIGHWFGYYGGQGAQSIERAIQRYAPGSSGAASAADYIPVICGRVRSAIMQWSVTGEVKGVPEGMTAGIPSLTGDGNPASVPPSISFKVREGGMPEVSDPHAVQAQLTPGSLLESGVRSQMESAFGEDFSGVRVHTDSKAGELSDKFSARAFTVGRDIAFATGEYKPGTLIGDALIAHELTHVVQQGGAKASGPQQKGEGDNSSFEEEADMSAVGAVASLWGGIKAGFANIALNALPRLRSGLKLQRCKSERDKEIERLSGIQYGFLDEKRKKKEEEDRKLAEEAAKKRGEVNPKIEVKVTVDDVLKEEVKKGALVPSSTDPWLKNISELDRQNYITVRAPNAWNKVVASVKGTELENVMKGKTYKFLPKEVLEAGAYAYQDGNSLVFGMTWVHNVEADPKNVWPNIAHELGGHFEYGKTYASEIMNEVIEKLPRAEREKWRTDKDYRQKFFENYEYPETEIYSALRELRYAEPLIGAKPVYGGMHPYHNIPWKLKVMKEALHPEVAKAVLADLKRRVYASPEILERDKKYFESQVIAVFGYAP